MAAVVAAAPAVVVARVGPEGSEEVVAQVGLAAASAALIWGIALPCITGPRCIITWAVGDTGPLPVAVVAAAAALAPWSSRSSV